MSAPQDQTATKAELSFPLADFEFQPDGMLWIYHEGRGGFWLTKEETDLFVAWVKEQRP